MRPATWGRAARGGALATFLVLAIAACADAAPSAPASPFSGAYLPEYRALVGVPDATRTLVFRDGTLVGTDTALPADGARSRRFQVRPDGAVARWTLWREPDEAPIAVLETERGGVAYRMRVFGGVLFGRAADLVVIDLVPREDAPAEATVVLVLADGGEGLSYEGGMLLDGDAVRVLVAPETAGLVTASDGGLTARVPLDGPRRLIVALPRGLDRTTVVGAGAWPDPELLLAGGRALWSEALRGRANVALPDPWYAEMWRASLAHVLLLRDRVEDVYVTTSGPEAYDHFRHRDAAYACRALDMAGLPERAAECLALLWQHGLPAGVSGMGAGGADVEQHADGRWEAPPSEWDGQGLALWALGGHHRLTGDDAWLAAAYGAMQLGARWIVDARTRPVGEGEEGAPDCALLPPGVSEGLVETSRVLSHDYWAVLGLREAARAAQVLGEEEDARELGAVAAELGTCVRDWVAASYVDLGGGRGVVPAAYGQPDSRIGGTIAALFPTEVLAADDPRLGATFEEMWRHRALDVYRFRGQDEAASIPITADWALALLVRDEWERAAALFDGLRALASPAYGWWEGVRLTSREGTGDDPHGRAAAGYVLWLRAALVAEAGEGTLALLRGAPPAWYAEGAPIVARSFPTAVGLLEELRVETRGGARTLTVRIAAPTPGAAPPRLVIYQRGATPLSGRCSPAATFEGDRLVVETFALACTLHP